MFIVVFSFDAPVPSSLNRVYRRSMNRATLIGTVGQDMEVVELEEDRCIGKFPLATSTPMPSNLELANPNATQWHQVVIKNPKYVRALAENNVVRKGAQVFVEGRIETRAFETDGVTKRATSIVVAGPSANVNVLWSPEDAASADLD
eukprot:TRINITY_DN2860_c0_g1_i2.p2 TRINITY_DN2860_c0_g1~~TRINITY_DN2860_c0_g1_i2.p2  ORF type:complete len:147 (+),score=54.49 TRINITY_DN2860_c0_g1_i2:187-627(+)